MYKTLNNLVQKLWHWCEKNGKTRILKDRISNKTYMIRACIFDTRFLRLYLHKFMSSDRPDPHDHPASFLTYIAKGSYMEEIFVRTSDWTQTSNSNIEEKPAWIKKTVIRKAGQFIFRKKETIHRIKIKKAGALTICLFGPRKSSWGFWPLKDKGNTFIFWKKYLRELKK